MLLHYYFISNLPLDKTTDQQQINRKEFHDELASIIFFFLFQVLKVKAVDGDRGIDNKIVYSITHGPTDLFGITPDSGIVYTKEILDRESDRSSNGAYIIGIRAKEIGVKGKLELYVDTEVTIMIEVRITFFSLINEFFSLKKKKKIR